MERLRAKSQLLDAGRVHLRALALCAREACHYRGKPTLELWLMERVDEAISQLLEEEQPQLEGDAWGSLAAPLGLEPLEAHAACRTFNSLSFEERRAFSRLLVDREEPALLSKELGQGVLEIIDEAATAFEQLLGLQPESVERAIALKTDDSDSCLLERWLHGLSSEVSEHALKLVRFFRILASDVAGLDEQAALMDDSKVREEYSRQGEQRIIHSLVELLRHYLCWYLDGRSFLRIRAPKAEPTSCWKLIIDELPVTLPEAGEPPLSIALRLLSSLEEHSASKETAALWRARWIYAKQGPAAGEDAFRLILEGLPSDGPSAS